MSQTWIDKVLSQLTQLQTGSGDLRALLDAVVTTQTGFLQQLQTFRASWPDNPEIDQQEASLTERSLVDLVDILTALQAALTAYEPTSAENWAAWIERIGKPLELLRQQRQRAGCWPTSNATVNRLLRHIEWWGQGHPAQPATRQLLDQIPALEEQWDVIIGQLEASCQSALWAALDPVLQVFDKWRLHLDGPPPAESQQWGAQVIESLARFDQLLAGYVEIDLASGPTAFPVINLLITATEQALDGVAAPAQIQALAQSGAQLLGLQVEAEILAESKVLDSLLHIERLAATHQLAALPEAVEFLVDRCQELSRLFRAYAMPEGFIDVKITDGCAQGDNQLNLPPMLSSLYQLAADYIDGRVPAATLRPGIRQLEEVVERFSTRPGSQADVVLALTDLTETVAILHDIETTPSLTLLRELEEVLHDCAQSLAALQV